MADCDPGADAFIARHFHDCVYNARDYVGFCLGLTAIVFWILAQLPQYVRNYKNKSAEALSPWFLAEWLLGDTFNLLGALLQGQQLPTTVYTAMYFVVADVFMMMQYIYYGALQRRRQRMLTLSARRRHHRKRPHHKGDGGAGRERPLARSSSPGPRPSAQRSPVRDTEQRRRHPAARAQQQQWDGLGGSSGGGGQQDMERGSIDGTSRQLWQAEQLLGQQQQQQPGSEQLPQSGLAACPDGDSDALLSSSSGAGSPDGSPKHSSAWVLPWGASREPGLPVSCSAAAAAAAAHAGQLPASHPGWPLRGAQLGASRLVVAVGALVCMGVVSLLVPASSHGLFPAAGVGMAASPGAAAAARLMQAGGPAAAGSHAMRSANASALQPRSSRSRVRGGDANKGHDWAFVIGTGLGYTSSVLYLASRVSQIHKTYVRKSTEGLALAMFMLAVCANLCTGSGIVLRTFTWRELREQLPWIIGSLGTISLDMVILWQSFHYRGKHPVGQPPAGAADGHTHRDGRQRHHHHGSGRQRYREAAAHHHLPGHAAAAAAAAAAGGGSSDEREPLVASSSRAADGLSAAVAGGGALGRRHAAAAQQQQPPIEVLVDEASPLLGRVSSRQQRS